MNSKGNQCSRERRASRASTLATWRLAKRSGVIEPQTAEWQAAPASGVMPELRVKVRKSRVWQVPIAKCLTSLDRVTCPVGCEHILDSNAAEIDTASRQELPPPAWFRFLAPSITDLIFIILLFAMSGGALAPRLLGDASIGWHIRNGEQMLRTHSITRTDPFSVTMGGHTWYAWEWLYDVAIAGIHHWLGTERRGLLHRGDHCPDFRAHPAPVLAARRRPCRSRRSCSPCPWASP